MCGIFGFVARAGTPLDRTRLAGTLEELFRLSEPRGREASGLAMAIGGELVVYKRPLPPSRMLQTRGYREFLDRAIGNIATGANGLLGETVAAIGHCRLVTNGAEIVADNNQPIVGGGCVGVHNGIVTNDRTLIEQHGGLGCRFDSDSEVLFRLIGEHVSAGEEVPRAVGAAFSEIIGAASVAFLREDRDALYLATNTGSLHHVASSGVFLFASERYILTQYMSSKHALVSAGDIVQVAAGSGRIVDFGSAESTSFELGDGDLAMVHAARPSARTARDLSSRAHEIKRCTRCVLPTTYPFIEFDEAGVCNYCHTPPVPELLGREALEAELSKYRRRDGKPDCIVALSGGRDSSYGLHLVKRELGLNPVAYSYDWGMVTGIARRNQSLMCAKLGVEHIVRAADIPSKRRFMRKNILAWLKRPHLGMVPLFMAGDKYFYAVGRALRRELGIPLVIFCAGNPLERTDFKSGFAGQRENLHGQRLFGLSIRNKVGLATFYAGQYLLNPSYINESLVDSVGSFFTTFVGKDDFLYLYHYLPWDEETINRTLIGEYGWETASYTDNTWRIGDGYTTFINHIYFTVAGFSEFDVFRSQQIRAGLLGRDEALRMLERDNQANMGVLLEFAQQVGINLEEVMTAIDAIPKLY